MHVGILFLFVVSVLTVDEAKSLVKRSRSLIRINRKESASNTHFVHPKSDAHRVLHQGFSYTLFFIAIIGCKPADLESSDMFHLEVLRLLFIIVKHDGIRKERDITDQVALIEGELGVGEALLRLSRPIILYEVIQVGVAAVKGSYSVLCWVGLNYF